MVKNGKCVWHKNIQMLQQNSFEKISLNFIYVFSMFALRSKIILILKHLKYINCGVQSDSLAGGGGGGGKGVMTKMSN